MKKFIFSFLFLFFLVAIFVVFFSYHTQIVLIRNIGYLHSYYIQHNNFSQAAKENNLEKMHFIIQAFDQSEISAKLLREVYQKDQGYCHLYAHRFGRVFYQVYGAPYFRDINMVCNSGFMHGALEGYLSEHKEENFDQDIEKLCYSNSTRFKIFECLHGVGHGALIISNYDLTKAIGLCEKLSTPYNRTSCSGGAFMENVTTALGIGAGNPHQTWWLNNNPNFPCDQFDNKLEFKYQCYWIQTAWMERLFNKDYKKITEVCTQIKDSSRAGCFIGIGRQAATSLNPSIIIERCNYSRLEANLDDYKTCIIGGMYVILENWGDKVKDQPQQFCRLTDSAVKKDCYEKLAIRLKGIFGNDQNKVQKSCYYFEKDYQKMCLEINK